MLDILSLVSDSEKIYFMSAPEDLFHTGGRYSCLIGFDELLLLNYLRYVRN